MAGEHSGEPGATHRIETVPLYRSLGLDRLWRRVGLEKALDRLQRSIRVSRRKRFYARVNRIRKITRASLERFCRLQTLDSETKQRLLRPLRRHQIELTALDEQIHTVFVIGFKVQFMASFLFSLFALAGPSLITLWLDVSHGFLTWVGVYMLYWGVAVPVTVLVPFGPGYLLIRKLRKSPSRFARNRLLAYLSWAWAAIVEAAYVALLYRILATASSGQVSILIHLVVASLLAQFGVLAQSVLFTLIFSIALYIVKRRKEILRPDAAMIAELIDLLHHVEEHPGRWSAFDFQQKMVSRLEHIAKLIEHDLRRQLRGGDIGTDAWLQHTTRRMAAYMRGLKRWVLIPKPDTREHFIEPIATSLIAAASGSWDSFGQSDPEPISRSQLGLRARAVLKALIVGALPVTVVGVIQQTSLALEGALADYILVGTVLWLVLTLLAEVDPRFKDKLEALKEVRDLLPL